MTARRTGSRVIETITAYCEECGRDVFVRPGTLSADGLTEHRLCEDGHPVDTDVYVYVSTKDATRFDL